MTPDDIYVEYADQGDEGLLYQAYELLLGELIHSGDFPALPHSYNEEARQDA